MNIFQGLKVIIAGGAGYIGEAFARHLIHLGTTVILLDKCQKEIDLVADKIKSSTSSSASALVFGYQCDLLDYSSVTKTVDLVVSEHERIDCAINTSGFAAKQLQLLDDSVFAPTDKSDPKIFETICMSNISLFFNFARALAPHFISAQNGVLVSLASDVGVVAPDQRIYQADSVSDYEGVDFNTPLGYSMAKAAIIHGTKHLAAEWAPFGVRVNCISPCGIARGQDPAFVKKLETLIPMGRMARLEDLLTALEFVCSPRSSMLTGQNIMVDGGRSIW